MPGPTDPLVAVARCLLARARQWPSDADLIEVRCGDIVQLCEAVLATEPKLAVGAGRERPKAEPSQELMKAFAVLLAPPEGRHE